MPLTAVRPGHVIRDILLGRQVILPDGESGVRSAPTDLFRTYKLLVKKANADGGSEQRGMSRHSFNGLLYQARRLGLVIPVDEEPSTVPAPPFARANLLNIGSDFPQEVSAAEGQPITAFHVVEARRVLYEIGGGNVDISPAWGNIPRYYMTLVERLRGG